MKKNALLILVSLTMAAPAFAGMIDISGSSDMSVTRWKVENGQDALAMEAVLLLAQGGEASSQLLEEVAKTRQEQTQVIGAEATSRLSDQDLLLIIANKK